jgi:hypothetical protein
MTCLKIRWAELAFNLNQTAYYWQINIGFEIVSDNILLCGEKEKKREHATSSPPPPPFKFIFVVLDPPNYL